MARICRFMTKVVVCGPDKDDGIRVFCNASHLLALT